MANNLPCRGRKIGDRQVAWSLEFDFCVGRLRGRWSFLLNNCGAAKITRIHGGYLRSPAVPPTDEKWSWLYHRDHTGGRLVAYDPILPILCHRQGPQDRRRGREFSLAAACRQSYDINARNQVFDATRPSAGSSFDLEVCSE